jgi:hypothetical protein
MCLLYINVFWHLLGMFSLEASFIPKECETKPNGSIAMVMHRQILFLFGKWHHRQIHASNTTQVKLCETEHGTHHTATNLQHCVRLA